MKLIEFKNKKCLLKAIMFLVLVVTEVDLVALRGGKVRTTPTSSWGSWLGFGKKSKVESQHKATMAERSQSSGYQPKSFTSSVKSSAPAQYLYHLPGEMSARVGGPRNIIYDRSTLQLGKKSTNPYLKDGKTDGYQTQSLLSSAQKSAPVQYAYHLPGKMSAQVGGPRNIIYDRPFEPVQQGVNYVQGFFGKKSKSDGYQSQSLLSSIKSSEPVQYVYHLPGEISTQVGGPRNILYNRNRGQQAVDGVSSFVGREPKNPYLRNKKDHGYKDTSLLSSIKASEPVQYVYHLPGQMSAQVGGPRNIIYDRSGVQQGVDAASGFVGVESSNPYVRQSRSSAKVVPSSLTEVPAEVFRAMMPKQQASHVRGKVSPYNTTGIPDQSFIDSGRTLYESGKKTAAVGTKQASSGKKLSLAEQEQRFLANRAAKQAAKNRGMTGDLSRFNVY